MSKYVVVAPVGDNMDALFVGISEFPTQKIVLVCPQEKTDLAQKTKEELERFKIPVHLHQITGDLWESTFKAISEIKGSEREHEVIINVATGDKDNRCAATSAAFVNGLKAFSVAGDQTMLLPVLKFSYYKMLTDRKMQILKLLYGQNAYSLDELSKRTGMSLPLISYHINGNLKSEGLKDLGLVETKEEKGKVSISLSSLGNMLIRGHIPSNE